MPLVVVFRFAPLVCVVVVVVVSTRNALLSALGELADRDVLEKIVYDFEDLEMLQLLRPSLHEAFVVQSADVALDYIGKRGGASRTVARRRRSNACARALTAPVGTSRDARIRYARDVLQKGERFCCRRRVAPNTSLCAEFLPHVGIGPNHETKKA